MSIEKSVLERLSQLPLEKRQEVLDFVEFLETKSRKKGPRRSLKGLWAGLGTRITARDIAEVRREMWRR